MRHVNTHLDKISACQKRTASLAENIPFEIDTARNAVFGEQLGISGIPRHGRRFARLERCYRIPGLCLYLARVVVSGHFDEHLCSRTGLFDDVENSAGETVGRRSVVRSLRSPGCNME